MKTNDWKEKSEIERTSLIKDIDKFNPYSDEVYDLVRNLGYELAHAENLNTKMVGVLNRFGELIIHLHAPNNTDNKHKLNLTKYYSFRVFVSDEEAWFKH